MPEARGPEPTWSAEGSREGWPDLPYSEWKDVCETLHRWTQIVGKVRKALTPPVNHWWHVPLYLTSRGLTTSPVPWAGGSFDVAFDLLADRLTIDVSDGQSAAIALRPMTTREFHARFLGTLRQLGIDVRIGRFPDEVPDRIAFDEDEVHASWDGAWVRRFWRALLRTSAVMQSVRGRFVGKASPIHFFWGSFDLALTWFDGRRAPARPELDPIQREAYSHRVISVGFWPGGPTFEKAAFYGYAAPVPDGLAAARVEPGAAYWHAPLGEFLLDYDDVRKSATPERDLARFYESVYEAAAEAAGWDRASLERAPA